MTTGDPGSAEDWRRTNRVRIPILAVAIAGFGVASFIIGDPDNPQPKPKNACPAPVNPTESPSFNQASPTDGRIDIGTNIKYPFETRALGSHDLIKVKPQPGFTHYAYRVIRTGSNKIDFVQGFFGKHLQNKDSHTVEPIQTTRVDFSEDGHHIGHSAIRFTVEANTPEQCRAPLVTMQIESGAAQP